MIIELPEQFASSLLDQPESGMGWQAVTVTFARAPSEAMIALNAEFLASNAYELRSLAERSGRRLDREALRRASRRDKALEIRSITVRADVRRVAEGRGEPGPAADAEPSLTGPRDEFRRFSAFENDRRVTKEKGLLPGTYTTTAVDGDLVNTGMDAVRRYALPNPMPANYEFVIRPPDRTVVREGIVQPANGQPGGGVEVIFVNGSPAKTVTRGRTLPDQ